MRGSELLHLELPRWESRSEINSPRGSPRPLASRHVGRSFVPFVPLLPKDLEIPPTCLPATTFYSQTGGQPWVAEPSEASKVNIWRVAEPSEASKSQSSQYGRGVISDWVRHWPSWREIPHLARSEISDLGRFTEIHRNPPDLARYGLRSS